MCSKRAYHYLHPRAWMLMMTLVATATSQYENGGGSGGWWDNISNETNSTELCTGVMHIKTINQTNSSSDSVIISSSSSSITDNYSPCSIYSYPKCPRHNNHTSLETDRLSYIGAQSKIVATVNPNATEGYGKLYYKLCYTSLFNSGRSEVIQCVSNGTTMISYYKWKESGRVILTVHVYLSEEFNDSDFLDCSVARVLVADNYGIDLNMELVNEHLDSYEEEEEGEGEEFEWYNSDTDEFFLMGNVTFVAMSNLSSGSDDATYHYHYIFTNASSPEEEVIHSTSPNLTREYLETGDYYYTVHVFASLDPISAHHANYTGSFSILEAVSDVLIQVGNNNSIRVGSREELLITAEGSPPITVCWSETNLQSPTAPPSSPPPAEDQGAAMKNGSLFPVEECVMLNESNSTIFREYRTFNVVGTFLYVAHFFNRANVVQENLTIHVTPTPLPPTVVVTSATAVVVLAVFAVLTVLIIVLVVGVYIPYRRYKNRMTETADFRFVDLSERGTFWDHFKLKSNQFMDYFRRRRHNEKIGLINLGAIAMLDERRLLYGSNTLT